MPLWPFRRRSRRKRGRANTLEDDGYGGQAASTALPPRSQTVPELMPVNPPVLERQPSKKQRTEPNKLHRRTRAYSFSPGRHDSVRVGRKKPVADVDPRFADHGVGANPSGGMDAVRDEMLWRVPTLHNKRDGDHLPRKVSSKKRRKEDQQREAEIKALSTFVPVRPATEDWMAGRPMKKESRRIRSALGGTIKGGEVDRFHRSSDVSLPLQESIDSALSSDSEHIAYKVSALAALSPRPTLRCTTHPRSGAGVRDVAGLARRPSQQRKLIAPIPEATLKAHKRVDDLADDLSASDLRELMERDERRRARKRQLEQEKVDRRIARRAEKQKAVEAEAARHGRESPPNLERGVLGREDKRKSSGIMEHGQSFGLPRETPESEIERQPELETTNDDMNITDDDYLSRLAPTNTDRSAWNRKSTGEARPSSDWGEEEAHWGSVRGQQPKVVRSGAVGRVKSREGLLRSFGEEGQSATVETVDQDDHNDGSDSVGLERATSIDYGKAHARRISAGSARLLSITPRSSVDAKHALVSPREKDS
ncbi:hypothetical protein NEMBOFW57_006815 [Staphylotrichum longicolle]|uniref:Uncharacterized protein n=1 Tax=Staphylotrichum longicolle TaxID=669026 RepID=A0AAD4ETC8_9PEZI|nr:hypothetical protein NEMBOFW57_006815 [Staphylotrichum longicolle]